ncbi:MAG TPA: ABC transporter permease [Propionibacteriaceae bacterium]|nr:ABC transporter permease [Propionibacteriaceae bacterium]
MTTTPTTEAPVRARALPPTRIAAPSFARLTQVELRKSVDYRAGRWILGAIAALSLLALGWRVWNASDAPITMMRFIDSAMTPVVLLVPVLGILAMASEWSQRTALTTFTLTPRRVRVLVAKVVAALLLSLGLFVTVLALTALAVGLAGLITGDAVTWSLDAKVVGGELVAQLLYVLMGAGFGALIPVTGAALTAFFVAPTLFGIISANVLKSAGEWFDVFGAFGRLSTFDLAGKGAQTATSVAVWIALPLAVGLWRSARREVK